MQLRIGFILAFFFVGMSFAQEDYLSDWSHYKDLTINTTAQGAYTSSTVTQFPLLVRLSSAQQDIFLNSQVTGADIRFSKDDGITPLPYQIERWDAGRQTAEIWVLVDAIAANSNTSIRMYWGNGSAADSSNGKHVFDVANGFQAVYHMNGDNDETDATSNNGIAYAFATLSAVDPVGAVGKARKFNGTNQYFYVTVPGYSAGTTPLNFQMTDNYTLSAWIYPTSVSSATNDGNAIIDKGNDQYILQDYANSGPRRWDFTTRGNGTYLRDTSSGSLTANSSIGGWHHLVGTYHGAAVGSAIAESLYYDGALVNVLYTTNSNNSGRTSRDVFIGSLFNAGGTMNRYWNGSIDEVQISSETRTADWIKLSYETQRTAATCVFYGPTFPSAPIRMVNGNDGEWGDTVDISSELLHMNYWYTLVGGGSLTTDLGPADLKLTWATAGNSGQTELNKDGIVTTGSIEANMITADSVIITPSCTVPDYVFEKGYKLRSLKDLESYVEENKHFPDIPAASEIQKGMSVGDMNIRLLKTMEEMSLHLINLNKKIEAQKDRSMKLEKKFETLTLKKHAEIPGRVSK